MTTPTGGWDETVPTGTRKIMLGIGNNELT